MNSACHGNNKYSKRAGRVTRRGECAMQKSHLHPRLLSLPTSLPGEPSRSITLLDCIKTPSRRCFRLRYPRKSLSCVKGPADPARRHARHPRHPTRENRPDLLSTFTPHPRERVTYSCLYSRAEHKNNIAVTSPSLRRDTYAAALLFVPTQGMLPFRV